MIVVNSIENNISRFQLSFNSQSTTFLLAWPVSPFPWRSRQEPTGADRSRQEPTGADRISVGLARVTLQAAALCLVAGSAAAGSSDPRPGWAGRRKPAGTSAVQPSQHCRLHGFSGKQHKADDNII